MITAMQVALLVFGCAYAAHAEGSVPLASYAEQIQLSSAGILGVASLGLLGIKLSKSNPVWREAVCLVAAYALLAIVLAAHLLAIVWAQQGTLLQFHYDVIMYLTVVLVVGILACFALLLVFQITMPNVDDALESIRSVAKDPVGHMKQAGADGRAVDNPGGVINNWDDRHQ